MDADSKRISKLIRETLVMLCKNGVHYQQCLKVQGLIGITSDDTSVILVPINELLESEASTDNMLCRLQAKPARKVYSKFSPKNQQDGSHDIGYANNSGMELPEFDANCLESVDYQVDDNFRAGDQTPIWKHGAYNVSSEGLQESSETETNVSWNQPAMSASESFSFDQLPPDMQQILKEEVPERVSNSDSQGYVAKKRKRPALSRPQLAETEFGMTDDKNIWECVKVVRFACGLCDRVFNHQPNLFQHQITAHGRQKKVRGQPITDEDKSMWTTVKVTKFQCKICQTLFNHQPNLLQHQITAHGRPKKARARLSFPAE